MNQKIREIASTTAPIDAIGSRTKGRNRDERRTITVFDPAEKLASTEWHPHVAAIVCVERKVFTRIVSSGLWDWSTETAFYVSNTTLTAVNAADAIRGHWKIETTPTTAATSHSARTNHVSVPTPACLLASAASPSTSSSQTRPAPSARTATAPLSRASITCLKSWRFHSVEQPCRIRRGRPGAEIRSRLNLRAEDSFARVVEASPNALVLVGQSGRIEMVNRQTERMFGHDRSAGGRTSRSLVDRIRAPVRLEWRSLRLIQWEGVNHVVRQKAQTMIERRSMDQPQKKMAKRLSAPDLDQTSLTISRQKSA